nr:hypothetical protein [Tanacetum cinerariifolium]
NEHLDTIPETESDEFIMSSVENLVQIPSESEDIFDIKSECDIPDCDDSQMTNFSTFSNPLFDDSTSSDDESSHEESYLLESLLNRDTLMASSPKFDSLLEKFFGELAHTDLIPPRINEAFYDDHVKEISSGSTTTHSDSSLYDSFIFDLSINPFPPADRSDFYEFADELTHIISLPKYDCVCFKIEPNSGDFTMDVVEDISPSSEPRVHNALPTYPTLQLNLKFILSSEYLFAYVLRMAGSNAFTEVGPDRKIKLDRNPGYFQAMLNTMYKHEYLRVRVIDDQVVLKNLPPNSVLIDEIMDLVKGFLTSKWLLKGEASSTYTLGHLRRQNASVLKL